MNCVLSGNIGLAFVLDGGRAMRLRAEGPEEQTEVTAEEFHRVFADVTDRVFLEGVALPEIRHRLSLACQASTALSLALLVLDRYALEDLRSEAAQDLECLIENPLVRKELEAVLSAAPFPKAADVTGAERACAQPTVGIVRDLLSTLVARQSHIRMVSAAWDALPAALFENEGNRRAARAVCVREGLFLAMVCHAEAGQEPSSFLMDALRKPTMLRSFARHRKVLRSWSAALATTRDDVRKRDSLISSELLQPDELDEQPAFKTRVRDTRNRAVVSINPGAKLLVDEEIGMFVAALPQACDAGPDAVARLVKSTRNRLITIHSWRVDERPHFIKSISNVAEQLLRRGESAAAVELLRWGLRKGLADAFTYNTLVDAWGKSGDAVRAQEVFDAAIAAGLADAVTYNTLVDAWGKSGDAVRAQEVFDAAMAAGLANAVTYTALVDAWGKSGDAVRAQEVFDAAMAAGLADAFTYTALVDAWGKSGDAVRAQEVFDGALTGGLATEITDLVLLRALLSNSVPRDVLTRAVESLLSRRRLERFSTPVASTVAWAAARLGRFDWIRSLPPWVRTGRTLYAFALRVAPSDDALTFLQELGPVARAGGIALRYRMAGATGSIAELQSLARDCHDLLEKSNELDSFSRVRITETEVRCLRKYGTIEEAIASWGPIDDTPIGNRETRASLLVESGRDLLIGGLRCMQAAQCVQGAQRLTQGWSVARLSDLNDLEAVRTASEALGGYADARVEMARASPELVSRVRPILAQGARDGRWAMDAVRTSDLPDFYLTPALAGMEFLAELKQSFPPPIRTSYTT